MYWDWRWVRPTCLGGAHGVVVLPVAARFRGRGGVGALRAPLGGAHPVAAPPLLGHARVLRAAAFGVPALERLLVEELVEGVAHLARGV